MSASRICLVLVLAGALAACAKGQPAAQDRSPLSWQGATADELIAGLGQPEARTALAGGETLLQYRWTRRVMEGGYTVSMEQPAYQSGFGGPVPFTGANAFQPRRYLPSQTVEQICIARFTLGADNRVSKIGWEGDGCDLSGR